jgi:hypothetical protein
MSEHTGASEPVEVYGTGLSGVLDSCCERVGLCPGRRPCGRRPPTFVRKEVVAVEVLFERVAGLDVGEESLTAS